MGGHLMLELAAALRKLKGMQYLYLWGTFADVSAVTILLREVDPVFSLICEVL